ncbi:MAG: urease subunit gamma, partial [Actinobacteria bacterium]|nr:urease subunit gamma [Actinomycetota bacterium]
PGVGPLLNGIAVEAVFSDGRRLVVVDFESKDVDVPGKVTRLTPITQKTNPDIVSMIVINESEIQISVTTHMHFFEANPKLRFNRSDSYGRHLDIRAGEHIDFPPGVEVSVNLVPITGDRILIGFAGLVDGPLDAPGAKESAIAKARSLGYLEI